MGNKVTGQLIVFLSLLGLGVSAYLTYGHYGASIVCIGSGCNIVDSSPYSEIFRLPVSVLGLFSYSLVFGLSLRGLKANSQLSSYLYLAIFGLSLSGVVFASYLTYLEFAVIKALCTWCLVLAVDIGVIFALALFKNFFGFPHP